jgi:hypothetical protein
MVNVKHEIGIGETRYLVNDPILAFDEFIQVPGSGWVEFGVGPGG